MICCLPSSPGKAWVTRIDWMISLSLRSSVRSGPGRGRRSSRRCADELLGDRRGAAAVGRGASRGRPTTIATGSKPAFSQNVLSSTAVVASSRIGGISSNVDDLALELAEAGELDLAGPVETIDLLGQLVGPRGSTGPAGPRPARHRRLTAEMRRWTPTPARKSEDDDGEPAEPSSRAGVVGRRAVVWRACDAMRQRTPGSPKALGQKGGPRRCRMRKARDMVDGGIAGA